MSYKYSSFGEILRIENGVGEDVTSSPVIKPYFTYTGREYDEESNLYYYRARYYDSSIGRFIQVDPDPGSVFNPFSHINKFSYVGNSPLIFVDPLGLFKVKVNLHDGKLNAARVVGLAFGGASGTFVGDFVKRNWAKHKQEFINVAIVGGALVLTGGAALTPIIIGAAIGGVASGVRGGNILKGALKGGAIAGISVVAISAFSGVGAAVGSYFGGSSGAVIGGAIGGAAGGAIGSYTSQRVVEGTSHKDISLGGVVLGGALGGVAGAYTGYYYKGSTPKILNWINYGTDGAADASSKVPEYREMRSAD